MQRQVDAKTGRVPSASLARKVKTLGKTVAPLTRPECQQHAARSLSVCSEGSKLTQGEFVCQPSKLTVASRLVLAGQQIILTRVVTLNSRCQNRGSFANTGKLTQKTDANQFHVRQLQERSMLVPTIPKGVGYWGAGDGSRLALPRPE